MSRPSRLIVGCVAVAALASGCSTPSDDTVEVLGVQVERSTSERDVAPSSDERSEMNAAVGAVAEPPSDPASGLSVAGPSEPADPELPVSTTTPSPAAPPDPEAAPVPPAPPTPTPVVTPEPEPIVVTSLPAASYSTMQFSQFDGVPELSGETSGQTSTPTPDGKDNLSPDHGGSVAAGTVSDNGVPLSCAGRVAPDIERVDVTGTATLTLFAEQIELATWSGPVDLDVAPGESVEVGSVAAVLPTEMVPDWPEAVGVFCVLAVT